MREYTVPNGMPLSVFENKYSRRLPDGRFQTWAERVADVVTGNFMLDPRGRPHIADLSRTLDLACAGVMPFSGRHLQHGDTDQPYKRLELHSNCATAMFSFMLFRLLLNGSGVGRDYSTATCRVDWSNMPDVRLVLSENHPDFKPERFRGALEPLREARHKYDSESERVRWFKVADTREGWAKIVEILETATWQEKHADKLFIFDFSDVREAGKPIMGLQGRPASGPLPLMDAIAAVASVKSAGMKPWKQALFIDHYLASCVVLGGARRAARMSTKSWRDRDVIEFIDIKRGGFLWSSNNSITVDAEFWEGARQPRHSHARRIFEAAVNAAYWDKTGEPGFINVDKMTSNLDGMDTITGENCISTATYPDLHRRTREMIDNVLGHVKGLRYPFITNPCQPAFAPVLTPGGIKPFGSIEIGDQVWSQDGWVSVINKWSTGVKPVYRYRTTAGVFYGTEDHKVIDSGEKIPVKEAECIDRLAGPVATNISWDPAIVMDGLIIGDGSVHPTSFEQVYLTIGQDDKDYFTSEIAHLITGDHAVKYGSAYKIITSVLPHELPLLPTRVIPNRYVFADRNTIASFLRGLYSANGSVVSAGRAFRVTLKTTSSALVEQVQVMLSALGIPSFFTTNKPTSIAWANGVYVSKESYDVNIAGRHGVLFAETIGFLHGYKQERLRDAIREGSRAKRAKESFEIRGVQLIGEFDVYDIQVSGASHTYWTGGCNVSNCGEIVLAAYGGYCVIGDVCLAHAETLEEAADAVYLMAQFLVRCNLMKCDYAGETARTNRIGVALTGIHEFAWTHFGLTFYDMIYYDHTSQHKANAFWYFIDALRKAAEYGADTLSKELGVNRPHTVTTIKPSGTISKVMNCTEGAHLPALAYYLRWVQYKQGDPALADLVERGYPVKDVSHRYPDHVVVGFPTRQPIAELMGDKVVTADEVIPEQHFMWLQLLEEHWLGKERGNQISYTLSYSTDKVTYQDYMELILKWQPLVRCCAVMPSSDWRESEKIYSYVPEQPLTAEAYHDLMSRITAPVARETYDDEALACESGTCPIELDVNFSIR